MARSAAADDRLIRLVIVNGAMGVLLGWALFASLVLTDVGRLGQLLANSDEWLIAVLLAGMGFGVTFGSIAIGTAVFLLPKQ